MNFQPDFRHFADVMRNRRPARLPLYEHIIKASVLERILGLRFRAAAQGYALGSGNSIPDYVPVENYLAMVRAAQTIRQLES